jgi:hypothetical protein
MSDGRATVVIGLRFFPPEFCIAALHCFLFLLFTHVVVLGHSIAWRSIDQVWVRREPIVPYIIFKSLTHFSTRFGFTLPVTCHDELLHV